MREIGVGALPLSRLQEVVAPERARQLAERAEATRDRLGARTIWNVSSTAFGGGVAEMLHVLLAYGRGAGLDVRWLVMAGDAEFFAITKRLHNRLHGSEGDSGRLGDRERDHFSAVASRNLSEMQVVVRAGDIVVVHDPQPAGMIEQLKAAGAHVVWRCHIGRDTPNQTTDQAWSFLRDFVGGADAFVFSRPQYPPPWVPVEALHVIPPSLDPFSLKNQMLSRADVHEVLRVAGLVEAEPLDGQALFVRHDGSHGLTRAHQPFTRGGRLPGDARVVVQVSRWDRLKDMRGVLAGFHEHLSRLPSDAHLVLAGPEVSGVSDDPEGADVLAESERLWDSLSARTQERAHLCCLPMDDPEENAHLVNALQRYASVVVQKSLAEGFGLTVTEPMWKSRAVVASAVGGIQDQIEHGVSGLLLRDPGDLSGFADLLRSILGDRARAEQLGRAAQARVRERYLGDRHLLQYGELLEKLLGAGPG